MREPKETLPDLLPEIVKDEQTLRWAASLLILPGWVRKVLLDRANDLLAVLAR